MNFSRTGIAFDRAGPIGATPIVLLHAGVTDRRMWNNLWPDLTTRDVVRLDLRGHGDSVDRPAGLLSPVEDVLDVLAATGIERCHLVGVSFGAGVAVEVALSHPEAIASLFLVAPGGSLITHETAQLETFDNAETAALEADDIDAAVEVNLAWWVDGPHREAGSTAPEIRSAVERMQRRAFELTSDWNEVDEDELDPPAWARLGDIEAPTLVLLGALDMDAIISSGKEVASRVRNARLVEWPDVAHLPPLEKPADFYRLLDGWLSEVD